MRKKKKDDRVVLHVDEPIVLNVGVASENATWNFGPICSPFHRFYLVREGSAQLKLLNQTIELKAGHLYLIPAFCTHTDKSDTLFVHDYMHVVLPRTELTTSIEQYGFLPEVKAQPLDYALFDRLKELCPGFILEHNLPKKYELKTIYDACIERYMAMPPNRRMELHGIVMQLHSRFVDTQSIVDVIDVRIQCVVDYIREHLSEPITIQQLSDLANVQPETFIRLFAKSMRVTPLVYVIRKRIERAKQLLLETKLSVHHICEQTGFNSGAYFSRQFKLFTGMTPTAFRKELLRSFGPTPASTNAEDEE